MIAHPPAGSRLSRLLAACLVLLGLAGCGVNEIPTREERAKAAWGEVENQYQRRADLIPNLVETVKGYAAHEKDVLEGVVRARAAAIARPPGPDVLGDPAKFHDYEQRQMELSGALGRLLAIVENYPDLKANQNFLQLQAELSDIENKIAASRRFFNNSVQEYNSAIQQFPAVLLAGMLGFTQRGFFELDEAEKAAVNTAPSVKF